MTQVVRHYGFAQVPRIVIRGDKYKDMSLIEKGLYLGIKDICGEDGECFYILRNLARELNTSISTLSRYIPKLKTRGLITAEKKAGTANNHEIWHIRVVDIWQENDTLYRPLEDCFTEKQSSNKETNSVSQRNNLPNSVSSGNKIVSQRNDIRTPQAQDCFYLNDRMIQSNDTQNEKEQEKEHVRETPIEAIASPSLDAHDDVCDIEQWIEDVCSRRDERVPLPVGDVFHDDAPVTEPTLLVAPVAPVPSLLPIATEKTLGSEQKQAKQEKVVSLTLSLPTDEWTPEALLQVFESHHGRRYPNGAKRKSDRIRDKELESCVTLHSMTDLWKGTTEEKSAYLLRLIVHQETRHENWWLDHNGHVLPHQFVEKDRIHTMADELDRLNKKAQFSVVSKTPQTDTQVHLSKLSEGFRILSPLELAQLPMDEKRAYHHAYNDYLRTQQGLPSQAARA